MKARAVVDISWIAVAKCLARANVCALRGSCKIHAFRCIGTCRNIDCENKLGQAVLRKQDEWLFLQRDPEAQW